MEIDITDLSINIKKERIRVVYKITDESGDALMTNAVSFNLKFPENQKLYDIIIDNIKEHIRIRLNTDDNEEKIEGRAILLDDDDDDVTPGDENTMIRQHPQGARGINPRVSRRRRRYRMPAGDMTAEREVDAALMREEREDVPTDDFTE